MRELRQESVKSRQLLTGLGVGTAVVAVDLLTKRTAAARFREDPIEVIPGLMNFVYTENFGSAFSLIESAGTFLSLAAAVAVAVVVVALTRERPFGEVVAFGFIGGGAAGNLIDRITRGEGLTDGGVIDWIQFPNFPVFNFADISINVGVGLLLILTWKTERAAKAVEVA